jgi:hypothetical protein
MEKKNDVKKTKSEKFLLTDEEDKQLLEEYKKMIDSDKKQVNISRWGGWDLGDGGVSAGSDI